MKCAHGCILNFGPNLQLCGPAFDDAGKHRVEVYCTRTDEHKLEHWYELDDGIRISWTNDPNATWMA